MTEETTRRSTTAVVGIGASAGGIEALSIVFDHMPPDTGAAFVVMLHLDPNAESRLAEVLGRHTDMPVVAIEDGMRLAPDRVHVITPGHTVRVRDGTLALGESDRPWHIDRPVDGLLESLAEAHGNRAVGIILSGTGTSGTVGLRALRLHGGLAIVQDPATAGFDGMPASAVAAGLDDCVVEPRAVGRVLAAYLRHPYLELEEGAQPEVEDTVVGRILALLVQHGRPDFSSYKRGTVVRRLQRRASVRQVPDLAEYASLLAADPQELEELSRDLLISVTGFFRDEEAWDALLEHVLRPLIRNQGREEELRLWTAGCATGEEAYSLGMLLVEEAEAVGKRSSFRIFATDLAEGPLDTARRGLYPGSVVSALSPERRARFFQRVDDDVFKVRDELRLRTTFARHDLLQDPPFSRLDLVACRNLLIYLAPAMQERVLALLHLALRPGGCLFLGSAESCGRREDLFEPISRKHRLYRMTGSAGRDLIAFPLAGSSRIAMPPFPREPSAPRRGSRVEALARQELARVYAPASVIVDGRGQVLHFHGATDPYLLQPRGSPTLDLLQLVRPGLAGTIRDILARLRDGDREAVEEQRVQVGDELRQVAVRARKLRDRGDDELVLVSFEDENARRLAAERRPARTRGEESESEAIQAQLLDTVEALKTANDDLRSSNEEVSSMVEELHSSNEELETSREELQSLNEELNTANSQLQSKIAELEVVNDDLANLLGSTEMATLFLDRELRIKRFTSGIEHLFHVREVDLGRPLEHFASRLSDPRLLADCRAVLHDLVPRTAEVTAGESWYARRVSPYRALDDGATTGLVATFVDVTARRRLERTRSLLSGVVESSWDAITVEDLDGTILDWNQGATRLFGHRREEAVGQSIHLVIPPELREELTGVKEAVRRGGALADLETLRLTKDGRRIPVRLSLSPVREASGEVVALSAIVRDISQELAAARQQQEMTARLESQVAARTRRVRLLQDLATIANESDLLRDALAQAQERLALDHGWVLGHCYRLEEGRLVAAEPWYFGVDRDWSDLVAALEERPLEPGEGLAGAVLAAVEPAATPDLEWLSERARQAAHRAGLTAAVATPIVAGGDVVAVLEFFSQQEIPWRAGLLDELTAAGVQLGRVAERAEMERVVAAAGLAEQRRIGEMLHDTCGQGLAGLMMSAQSLKSRLEEAGAEEAGAMRTLLDDLRQLHQDTRLVARGLVPVEVDGQGLERALERMVEETCEHYPLSCRMVTEGGPVTLDDPFNATHLFYVAQEAVVNAARHSGASEIVVTLRSEGHRVAVEVRDDGRGFSPSEAVGLGLNIMRHRARLIGAELVVDSSPGRGTRVLCTLTG